MLVEAGLLSQPDPLEGLFPPRARRVLLLRVVCACVSPISRQGFHDELVGRERVQRAGQALRDVMPLHLGSSLPHALAPHRSIIGPVFVRSHTPVNIEQPCHTQDIRLNLARRRRRTQAV